MAAVLVSNETIKGMRDFMNHMASTNLSMQFVTLCCCLKFDLTSRNDYVFPPVFYALIGDDNVSIVPVALFVFSLTNTVANPVIQIYFRREMRHILVKTFCCWIKESPYCHS